MRFELVRRLGTSIAASSLKSKVKPFLDIPGPKSIPVFGSIFNYIPPFGKFDPERLQVSGRTKYDLYGPLVREEVLPGLHYLFVYDPQDIETLFRNDSKYPSRRSHTALQKIRIVDTAQDHNSAGLLPTSGEEWYRMRVQFQQALALENIRNSIPKTDEILRKFCNGIETTKLQLRNEDFLPHLMRLGLELVGENFFGVGINNEGGKEASYLEANTLIKAAEEVNAATFQTDTGLQLWKWIDTPYYKKIKTNILTIEKASQHLIQKLKNMSSPKPKCIVGTWLEDESADIKDVVTMSADMILAGIDTTSFTLSFLLYHLAKNPDCQSKLFQELKGLLPSKSDHVGLDTLTGAVYLKRCIKESLRLNPISIGVGRVLQHDMIIRGYQIPANTVIVTMNQVTCRLPKYFDQPDDFVPDRWEPQNRRTNQIHPFLLLPFGHGPRGCIGRRLAEQQLQLITARIIRSFSLEWLGSKDLVAKGMINRPDAPLQFKFTSRLE